MGTDRRDAVRSARLASLCREAGHRASDIVRDLTHFSRPETTGLQIVDIDSLLQSTLRILGSKLKQTQTEVQVDLAKLPPVEGHAALLGQTFANLILNAAAAMGDGGSITVTGRRITEGRIRLVFQDTGPGIPSTIKNRIFEPFFTTKEPGKGTGLGLSLCHTFIKQHGGRIWEEGPENGGARFVIELPAEKEAEEK